MSSKIISIIAIAASSVLWMPVANAGPAMNTATISTNTVESRNLLLCAAGSFTMMNPATWAFIGVGNLFGAGQLYPHEVAKANCK